MRKLAAATLTAAMFSAMPALAQVTVAPPTKPVAAKAGVAAPVAPAASGVASPSPAQAAARGRECTRLPLSDIQFGRDYTIKVARDKLEEYAQKVAKARGWKNGYTRSADTASCEDYLWLPVGGQEYKCLVTATFCRK